MSVYRLFVAIVAITCCLPAAFGAQDDWPEVVRVGLIPTEGGANIVERFEPLMEHLEEVLGVPVEAYSATDYEGIIVAMANGHIECAYFGPRSYVAAAERADAEAVAMELNADGNPGYYGVIITHRDSGITTLEEARGHTFAFTDPNSTSGYLVPNILFYRDLEEAPDAYFSEVVFSGSHGASILSVRHQRIDVAATNDIDIGRLVESGQIARDELRILWTSELIPGSPMCVRADLPDSFKAAFCGALMFFNRNEAGLERLGNGGYAPSDDTVYDVIRYLNRLRRELQNQ